MMSLSFTRLCSALLLSAAALPTLAASSSSTLIWRGDVTTARDVVEAVAASWDKTGQGHITLQPFNTASGLDAVAKGTADIGGSARGGAGGSESQLTFTPVAWDALVMITHPGNPVGNLTLKQVHDVYYGKITNWKELGGKDEPINVYAVASPGDGVEYSLRRLLFGRGNQPVAAPRLYMNTTKLEEAIALDPKALGVTTLGNVYTNQKVKLLKIDGTGASASTVANGSYPLYTPLYLVTSSNSPKAKEVQGFLDYLNGSAGQAILRKHDLIPYADGSMLASMDTSRRSHILAEVGAHASTITSEALPTAIAAAPALKLPAHAAHEPAKLVAARDQLAKTSLVGVKSQAKTLPSNLAAANTPAPSLKHLTAEAITIADVALTGTPFVGLSSQVFFHSEPGAHGSRAALEEEKKSARSLRLAAVTHAEAKPLAKLKPTKTKAVSHRAVSTYRVRAGDTLYSIAKRHAVDVSQMRRWNRLSGNQVETGQVLRLSAR